MPHSQWQRTHWSVPSATNLTIGQKSVPARESLTNLLAPNVSSWATLCLTDQRNPGSEPATGFGIVAQDWRELLLLTPSQEIITWLELRAQIVVAGKTITFLLDTGATYSALISSIRPYSWNYTVLGDTSKPMRLGQLKKMRRAISNCEIALYSSQGTASLAAHFIQKLNNSGTLPSFRSPCMCIGHIVT